MTTAATEETLEQLRYQTRALSATIWQSAVCRLVERSAVSRAAFELLREMLLSDERELRYRAVVGLQEAAQVDSEALVQFVRDRWEESETLLDPVFLDGLARACLRLPEERQKQILDEVWNGSVDTLKSSTLPLLWRNVVHKGRAALEPAMRDGSAFVRAHLGLELVEQLPNTVAFEALTELVQDHDSEVRSAVAVALMSLASSPKHPRHEAATTSEFKFLYSTLEKDPEATVRGALGLVPQSSERGERDHTTRALEMASELDSRPETTLQKLSPWLRLAGAWHRLKAIAEFSCHPEVAQAARALAALCDEEASLNERLLRCVGSLKGVSDGSVLMELKKLAENCLRIIEFSRFNDLAAWSIILSESGEGAVTLQSQELYLALRIVADAWQQGGHEELSETLEQLQELRQQSGSGPLPERELIEPALDHLVVLLQEELGNLLDQAW